MTDKDSSDKESSDQELINRVQGFIKITFLGMFLALIVGGVFSWQVYENHSSGTIYRIELLIPIIIAAVITGVGLRIYRGKLFASKVEFKRATELFKQKMEAKNN